MNLNHLAIFHAVDAERSVGRAADRLGISQPAVSKQLKLLERSFAAPLFDRTPRGMVPTAAGQLLGGYARRLFALADEAEQAMDELRGLERGTLSVGASTTLGVYLLPDVLVAFRRASPAITVHMEILGSDAMQIRLAAGSMDVGLTEGQVDPDAFEAEVLFHDGLVAVAAPGHPLTGRRKPTAADLCREPFVVRETGSDTKSLIERALTERGLSVKPAMSLGSTEAIKKAVAAGVGVAVISRMAAAPDLRARQLGEIRLSDLPLSRPIHLVRMRGRHLSRAAAAFIELLRSVVSDRSRTRDLGRPHQRQRERKER